MTKQKLRSVRSVEATPAAAERIAQNWSDEVLACRSGLMNHNFQPYTATHNTKLRYYFVVLRCPRCTTRKKYEIAESGEVIGRAWYSYPPGYLTKGKGRITGAAKDVVRKQAVKRLFEVARMTPKEAKDDQPRPKTLILLQGGVQ